MISNSPTEFWTAKGSGTTKDSRNAKAKSRPGDFGGMGFDEDGVVKRCVGAQDATFVGVHPRNLTGPPWKMVFFFSNYFPFGKAYFLGPILNFRGVTFVLRCGEIHVGEIHVGLKIGPTLKDWYSQKHVNVNSWERFHEGVYLQQKPEKGYVNQSNSIPILAKLYIFTGGGKTSRTALYSFSCWWH